MKAPRFVQCLTLIFGLVILTSCMVNNPVWCDEEIKQTGTPEKNAVRMRTDALVRMRGGQSFVAAPYAEPVDCDHGVYLGSRSTAVGTFSYMGRTSSVITMEPCEVEDAGTVSMVGRALNRAAIGDQLNSNRTGTTAGIPTFGIELAGSTGGFVSTSGSAKGRGVVDPISGAGEYGLGGMIYQSAGDGPAREQLPFKARAECNVVKMECADENCAETSTFDDRCSVPSTWVIRFTIDGDSEPLGLIEGWAEHCSQVTWAGPGIPSAASYSDGRMELTLEDGERVWGTYTNGVGVFLEDGTNEFQDEFTFTGGTGRYRNLRGGGVEWGTATTLDEPIPLWMEGWIRY
jgi:hypothetical protein